MIRAIPLCLALLAPIAAKAEFEISAYGGWQTAPHSSVQIEGDSVLSDQDFRAGWVGDSFSPPPYYGLRATWWQSSTFGFGVDFNHAKVYADGETLAATGFEQLEFSDGLNILTVNAYRRWGLIELSGYYYVGGGLGVSIPHVELFDEGTRTFGYQLTGPAVAWMAGVSIPIDDTWSMFGEYKGTYSMNEADLDTGGTLETDIITNAINFGVSYRF